MAKLGSFAFSYLPVMFAIAIPLGMARENKGVAAFAGFVGYAVLNLSVNFWLNINGILPTTDAAVLKANNVQNILGIQSIDTGILGAVVGKSGYNTPAILAALGGIDNITSLDNCLTRLRLSIADMNKVDDAALKANGAIGVVHLNKTSLQVVIGPQVQSVKDEMAHLMSATAS